MNRLASSLIALLISVCAVYADSSFDRAKSLYDNKLYAQAMDLFQSLPQCGRDAVVDGYVVLCAQKQHLPGYENLVSGYLGNYSGCSLSTEILKEKAYDLFDQGKYQESLAVLVKLKEKDFEKKERAEFIFKTGYCHYKLEQIDQALEKFRQVDGMMLNDFSAAAQYLCGYIAYGKGEFAQALSYFERSVRDERFSAISNYYIINCHFQQHDYDFVVNNGVELFENEKTPAERKANLARIISESYLVKGQNTLARKYYELSSDDSAKSRADYFYAGSLMYATKDYRQAVENFTKMPEKTDSLGQIAWYESAFSYLGLKNRVAALDAFKNATELTFDKKITEDAFFNYAKLAFDLNGDTSVFAKYIATYSDKVRGDLIYSYMALTALADKDYQMAIDAYDKIDALEGQEKRNYINANYLRAVELLEAGAYRKAAPCFQAVTYYAEKDEIVSQLANYGLGEAYYRNGRFEDAVNQYSALYNNSALYGMNEGKQLSYNTAYAYLKAGDYANAQRWFNVYLNDGGKDMRKDAMLRAADCLYAQKEYAAAVDSYQSYLDSYFDANEIYPYYQEAVCLGLCIEPKAKARKQNEQKRARMVELLSQARAADAHQPYYSAAMLELGRTLHRMNKNTDALAVFRELALNATDTLSAARATLEIGTLKRNVNDINGSLNAYKKVVEMYASTGLAEDALMAIESIYQSQHQPQKYIAYLESIGRAGAKTDEEKESMYFSAAEQVYFSDNYTAALDAFYEYLEKYPRSTRTAAAYYYIGESYRLTGDKVQACEAYERSFKEPVGPYTDNALKQFAILNFSMDNFEEALAAYERLGDGIGAMRSAYKARLYETAVQKADKVLESNAVEVIKSEAGMVKARSLLAMSRRDEAYEVLADLARNPKLPEGAEASYMIILDHYEKAEFDTVKEKVYALADSGTQQQYYLAKAFVVLGDSFVEQGKLKQAEATFNSVAEGFKDDAELNDEVQARLKKLAVMKNE